MAAKQDTVIGNPASPTTPPVERCRDLLGDEAAHLADAEVLDVQRHAELMARLIVEAYLAVRQRRA